MIEPFDLENLAPGRRLALERLVRRVTQQRLAARAGISEVYLSKLETGRRPMTPALLDRLRLALEIETRSSDLRAGPADRLDKASHPGEAPGISVAVVAWRRASVDRDPADQAGGHTRHRVEGQRSTRAGRAGERPGSRQ